MYIVGIQRSGTEMLVEALRRCPEVHVFNESAKSPAFDDYRLRPDPILRELIERSGNRCVAFKALCDSHRVLHLMEGIGTQSRGLGIWSFRMMEGRVRSVLAKWPENNRRVLRQIAAGDRSCWEAGGLSQDSLDLVRAMDYDEMTPESGAALLWYVRNRLFFELCLHTRADVALVSYERVLTEPEAEVRSLSRFLGIAYNPRMSAHIARRPPPTDAPLEIDPVIEARCRELEARFSGELHARFGPGMPASVAIGASGSF